MTYFFRAVDVADVEGQAVGRDVLAAHQESGLVLVGTGVHDFALAVNDAVGYDDLVVLALDLLVVDVADVERGEDLFFLVDAFVGLRGRFQHFGHESKEKSHHDDYDGGVDDGVGVAVGIQFHGRAFIYGQRAWLAC